MFKPRRTRSRPDWLDEDDVKIYTISADNSEVDQGKYLRRLQAIKQTRSVDWPATPAFVIFHEGASCPYLVLAWWGNDNELFTSVSALVGSSWVEDPARFSFCLWDLEVMWFERNAFVKHVYCERPNLGAYRAARFESSGDHHENSLS